MINLFAPDDDIITPCVATAPYVATPERRLWIRVLEFTLEDPENNPGEILKWIDSDDFKFICKAVGCRPGEAARHLRLNYG